ncbi:MAG TPA: TatD family hydrolase [Acidobacteriota bacterium]|nr:TatD family hydrolase [Acidobacteriota bacterium]
MTSWIDAHTHLDSDSLFPQRDAVTKRALEAGVSSVLLVNSECTEDSFQRTLACLREESPLLRWASFGVHPHQASRYEPAVEARLRELLKTPGAVALGEIGLDYYYDYSPRDAQQRALREQLTLSRELSLPVVIHCRDAYGELAGILKEEASSWRGMIHCFTGSFAEAEPLLALGFMISFSGIVTFKNADLLRDAARRIPSDRILVETDAPFLAPVPHRGKTNEPAFVADTGRCVAEQRQVSPEDFSAQTTRNFKAVFGV